MQPQLVADTGKRYTSIKETAELEDLLLPRGQDGKQSNVFKSAHWTSDGTTILTNSEDNVVRTFVLPTDLLSSPDAVPHSLSPYLATPFPEPVYAIAPYPSFTLSDLGSTCFLASVRDQPIRLQDALSPVPHLRASYHLIQPETERVITPHSLTFSHQGERFVAGSENLIAIFDVSRPGPGEQPLSWLKTTPSKRARAVVGGFGLKGIVSTLDISSEGVLAAGTFSRGIGLYDSQGAGDCIAVFTLDSSSSSSVKTDHGQGVTQVKWSSDGRYLFIAERKSDVIQVYDIRVTGRRVALLRGRKADTNQKLGLDISGDEVWAGGVDGKVRVWKYGGAGEESQKEEVGGTEDIIPTTELKAHRDPLTSTIIHPSGMLVATSSGQRRYPDFETEEQPSEHQGDETSDNSLKIWYLK